MAVNWISVEKESPSDEKVRVVDFLAKAGEEVQSGQPIVELEGSKSVYEVEAPVSGFLFFYCAVGDTLPTGSFIAAVCDTIHERPADVPSDRSASFQDASPLSAEKRFSRKARDRAVELGIDLEHFKPELDFVTVEDLETEAGNHASARIPLLQERIVLVGGGMGANLAYEVLSETPTKRVVGVIDENSYNSLSLSGVPLIGSTLEILNELYLQKNFDSALVCGWEMAFRVRAEEYLSSKDIPLSTVVHPRANVASSAVVGDGCLIMAGARIGPHAELGRNVFISSNCNIDHHCLIGTNSSFGPGVALSGAITVGANCAFGTLVGVEPRLTIGDNVTIASGSIITSSIRSNVTVKTKIETTVREK